MLNTNNIEFIENITVLKKLLCTYRAIANLRSICAQSSHSIILINSLATTTATGMITDLYTQFERNLEPNLDIQATQAIWDQPFDYKTLNSVISIFHQDEYLLSKENAIAFNTILSSINHLTIDPILKFFFFGIMSFPIISNIPEYERIIRVLGIRFLKEQDIIEFPILWHNKFARTHYYVQQLELHSLETVILEFLNDMEYVCYIGTYILKITKNKLSIIKQQLTQNSLLSNLNENEKLFDFVFGAFYLTIQDTIDTLNWKRDKGARFLQRLVSAGYFIERKKGKEKVFINNMILEIISEICLNSEIQEFIQSQ